MCGIAGFLNPSGLPRGAEAILRRMTDAIAHRGPDDAGTWLDGEAGVAVGHRRLAVIDLSPAGHQPMVSASGRYIVDYNGEIYNYQAIRAELEAAGAAPAWRGHSDTEVMVAALDHWGIRATLERLNGMFAFAVWDRETRVLTLARDRFGEKPLYYGRMGETFLFGSELKALSIHPAFVREVDRGALALYLRHLYVPAPRSIWRGILKLPPAHYVEIRDGGRSVGEPTAFWDFPAIARAGQAEPLTDGPALVDRLEALLKDAVLLRMEADVPLGAFLSGGVDSSTIVALMQAQSARPVRTFTIGFHEGAFDEAVYAKKVAAHLGTDHTEMYVTPGDALAVIPKLPGIWDEPFSDSSQIPTYLVSELTREHVTVSLSGDGGDELFGGYNRYFLGMRIWKAVSRLPMPLRRLATKLLSASATGRGADALARLVPRYRNLNLTDRLPKVGQIVSERSPIGIYRRLVSHFDTPASILVSGIEPPNLLSGGGEPAFSDFRNTMMYLDTLGYLPDDILAKVDRASMAVSLESRVPFLDHRVAELAWRLPISAKIRGGVGKRILREVLYRHVPKHLVERPKMGFGVPMASWLAGPLRDWAESLLDEARLRDEGFFDPVQIRTIWAEFKSGKRAWQHHLWTVLMFQAWWAENRGDRPSVAFDEPVPQKLRA
jgi:asparagine synthase (glutamine-hydrolysing)